MAGTSVSLFIPCLVDQVYPEMGLAMAKVLRHLGYVLRYNPAQTCCGQPAWNAGQVPEARRVAAHFLDCFRDAADWIVCPSGSCTGMVRNHYQELFAGAPRHGEAVTASRKVRELSEFLAERGDIPRLAGRLATPVRVAFHNSCHSYRELGIARQPFDILAQLAGCELCQPDGEPVCCGFGGLFYVKFPEVSTGMAKARLRQLLENGAELIVSNDPGCIMNLRQEARSQQLPVRILHLAEFLAEALKL